MNCDKYTEWLSAALDGELTAEQRRELDAHLASCPSCAALFETLSANARNLRELDCQFPEGLHDRIMGSLPSQIIPAKKSKVIPWKRWGSLAACLVVVVALGVLAGSGSLFGGSMAPKTAEAEHPIANAPITPGAVSQDHQKSSDPQSPPMDNSSAAYSGENNPGSVAPEAVISPIPTDIPSAEPTDNGGSGFGDRTPVFSPAPSVSKFPGIGDLESNPMADSQTIRVAYGRTPAPSAVVISSADSLADYLKGFGSNRFDEKGNPLPNEALEALKDTYTDSYFADHCLVAVVIKSGSGSIRYEAMAVEQGTVFIRAIVPEIGTADMAAWLIVIELDTMLDDGSVLDVSIN